jgi:hypothetical protein
MFEVTPAYSVTLSAVWSYVTEDTTRLSHEVEDVVKTQFPEAEH